MTQHCSVIGCKDKICAKSLCYKHYYRMSRYGGPEEGIDYGQRAKDRFLGSFAKDGSGCHVWIKSKDRYGYGKMSIMKKSVQAHRFSWEMNNDAKIPPGMVVMHLCNNKSCVNPDHLKIGTQSENMAHALSTKRSKVGFLSEDQVKFIRSSEMKSDDLAKILGVGFSCIDDVRKFKTWKNV